MEAESNMTEPTVDFFESHVTQSNIRMVCLMSFWIEFVVSSLILMRQLKHLETRQWRPTQLRNYPQYTEGIYHMSAALYITLLWQDIKIKLFTTAIMTVTICSDVIPFLWDSFQFAESDFDFTPDFLPLEMKQDISFGFWFAIFELLILEFPFKFFRRQLLQAHGFYNKSMMYFTRNYLEHTVLQTMHRTLTSFFLSFFINVYDEQTLDFHTLFRHTILAIFYCASLFIFELFETVITYMDHETFKPLPPGELRERCKAICQKTGYPIENVFIEDVPIEHPLNAYCVSYFGLYTRIVFISSIIGGYYDDDKNAPRSQNNHSPGLTLDELEGIFAHEVGHWMRSHNERNVTFYNLIYEPILFALAMWFREQKIVYEAFHFASSDTENLPYPLLPGLFIAQQIVLRMPDEGFNSLWNIAICKMELDADNYAASTGYGARLKAGLVRFKVVMLGFPSSDYIFTLFYDHHPTICVRMDEIDKVIVR